MAEQKILEQFEIEKVVFNGLSDQTREYLEKKIPHKGSLIIRRTTTPFPAHMQVVDGNGRPMPGNNQRYDAQLLGQLRIRSTVNIMDPFTGSPIQVINVLRLNPRNGRTEIEEVNASFARNTGFIEFNLANFHERQTAAMFYLMEDFAQNILRNGKPAESTIGTRFEVVDTVGDMKKDLEMSFGVAELLVKTKALSLPALQLLAGDLGYPEANSERGMANLQNYVKSILDNPDRTVEVQKAFAGLDDLNVEAMVRRAGTYGIIVKDEENTTFKEGKAPVFVYNQQTDNHWLQLAHWLNSGASDKTAGAALKRIQAAHDIEHGKFIAAEIKRSTDKVLNNA